MNVTPVIGAKPILKSIQLNLTPHEAYMLARYMGSISGNEFKNGLERGRVNPYSVSNDIIGSTVIVDYNTNLACQLYAAIWAALQEAEEKTSQK